MVKAKGIYYYQSIKAIVTFLVFGFKPLWPIFNTCFKIAYAHNFFEIHINRRKGNSFAKVICYMNGTANNPSIPYRSYNYIWW